MGTSSNSSNRMSIMLPMILKISAVLWGIWGIFHLFIGTTALVIFSGSGSGGNLKAIPEILDLTMMGRTNVL